MASRWRPNRLVSAGEAIAGSSRQYRGIASAVGYRGRCNCSRLEELRCARRCSRRSLLTGVLSVRISRGEPCDRQRICPTRQLTRDAERVNSRRPPFLRPLPRLVATSRRRSRPLTLPQQSRQPTPENRPFSRFLTPSDPPNSPTLGGSLPTRANPRPPRRGRIQA